jgi:hypothetical protein
MSKSLLFFTFYLALPFLVVSLLSPVQVRINHRINSIKPERLKNKFFQNDITSAKFSMVKHTSLQAGRSISLDTALLAGGKSELQKLGFVMLFITLIACQLLRSSRIERSNNTRKSTESREDSGFITRIIKILFKAISVCYKSFVFEGSFVCRSHKGSSYVIFGLESRSEYSTR